MSCRVYIMGLAAGPGILTFDPPQMPQELSEAEVSDIMNDILMSIQRMITGVINEQVTMSIVDRQESYLEKHLQDVEDAKRMLEASTLPSAAPPSATVSPAAPSIPSTDSGVSPVPVTPGARAISLEHIPTPSREPGWPRLIPGVSAASIMMNNSSDDECVPKSEAEIGSPPPKKRKMLLQECSRGQFLPPVCDHQSCHDAWVAWK